VSSPVVVAAPFVPAPRRSFGVERWAAPRGLRGYYFSEEWFVAEAAAECAGPLLKTLFAWNHRVMMASGEQSLRRYLGAAARGREGPSGG